MVFTSTTETPPEGGVSKRHSVPANRSRFVHLVHARMYAIAKQIFVSMLISEVREGFCNFWGCPGFSVVTNINSDSTLLVDVASILEDVPDCVENWAG